MCATIEFALQIVFIYPSNYLFMGIYHLYSYNNGEKIQFELSADDQIVSLGLNIAKNNNSRLKVLYMLQVVKTHKTQKNVLNSKKLFLIK